MNWATFLVSKLLQARTESQEKGVEFHYAWLLILIAMVGWKEPAFYQRMRVSGHNTYVAIYANSCHSTIKRRNTDTNIVFYSYFQFISKVVEATVQIFEEAIIAY
jgi:hypothetical protein